MAATDINCEMDPFPTPKNLKPFDIQSNTSRGRPFIINELEGARKCLQNHKITSKDLKFSFQFQKMFPRTSSIKLKSALLVSNFS